MGRLASMTGYARASGAVGGLGFLVEMRSVNARGLDLRLRIAPGFDQLEGEIRKKLSEKLSRGALSVTLTVDRSATAGRVVVNQEALDTVLEALRDLEFRIEAQKPTLDGILGLKGVLEQQETAIAADDEALATAILAAVDAALDNLVAARAEEGARIVPVLSAQIDEIAALTARAEAHPARTRSAVLARLRAQVAELLEAAPTLSEERLAQEALLAATRADIREELDRLAVHIAAARKLVAEGGPVGRKLDFLSQEFNREANTLCSKSNDVTLTAIGLDLKAVIDQLREQVQNIE